MPKSRTKQRLREKPLKNLRWVCRRASERGAEQIEPRPSPQAIRKIACELFRFANPWCHGFHDAPIPSQRLDLMIEYARRRFSDTEGSFPTHIARELQALPDSDPTGSYYRIGDPLPSFTPYNEVRRAFRSLLIRKGQLDPKTP